MGQFLGALWDLVGARIINLGTPVNSQDGVPKSYLAYDIPFVCSGKPNAGETFGPLLVIRPGIIPANFAGSAVRCRANPAAQQTLFIKRTQAGGTSAASIGSVTINTDGSFVFSTQAAITLNYMDFLDLSFPSTQDSAMSDIGLTIAMGRG
jgi:hypothetical protein